MAKINCAFASCCILLLLLLFYFIISLLFINYLLMRGEHTVTVSGRFTCLQISTISCEDVVMLFAQLLTLIKGLKIPSSQEYFVCSHFWSIEGLIKTNLSFR